jgi:hypothetical protein
MFWGGISLGNILALVAIIGGTVAVYTEIRSNQAVESDRITTLSHELQIDRTSQQVFSEQMRSQLIQLSKDIAFLQGQLTASEKIKK